MEKLLSIDDLSDILGVTKATIYSWTSQNKIPHIKISKRLLKFKQSDILQWIENKSSDKNSHINRYLGKNQKLSLKAPILDDDIDSIIRRAKRDVSEE